jgi:signal transduction histidine kinase
MSQGSERDAAASRRRAGRSRTDATIRREREHVDRILGRDAATSPAADVDETRRETDGRLSVERDGSDAGLAGLTEALAEEKASHSAADGALLTHQEFVAITSHDLRNDLSIVSVNAALLLRHAERHIPREEDHARIRSIQRSVAHMDRLVSDLLDLARIDVGKLEVKPEVQDAVQVIRESVESLRPVANAKSVSLRAVLPEARLPARLDPPRIHQVMANLLGNAIKFSPENGEVHVEARRTNRFVEVEVRDSGTGIAEDHLKVIFERYAKLESFQGSGLGLGLYIARWIVDAHGGRIWARSRVGEGSTFGFCLPRVAMQRGSGKSSSMASAGQPS